MTDRPAVALPRLGQPVHYLAHGSADGTYPKVCRAAIVTQVSEDEPQVSLAVLNPTGLFFGPAAHAEVDDLVGGTWHYACVSRVHGQAKEVEQEGPVHALVHGVTDPIMCGLDFTDGKVHAASAFAGDVTCPDCRARIESIEREEREAEESHTKARVRYEEDKRYRRAPGRDLDPTGVTTAWEIARQRFEGQDVGEVMLTHAGRELRVLVGVEYGKGPFVVSVYDVGPETTEESTVTFAEAVEEVEREGITRIRQGLYPLGTVARLKRLGDGKEGIGERFDSGNGDVWDVAGGFWYDREIDTVRVISAPQPWHVDVRPVDLTAEEFSAAWDAYRDQANGFVSGPALVEALKAIGLTTPGSRGRV